MTIEFRRFRTADLDAIERLNRRLQTADLPHRVGRESADGDEPTLDDRPIIERLYVAADGSEIRGAVWLKEQLFWSGGRTVRAGWAIYPVSESLVDKRFAGVPASMIFGLLRVQPRLMALGMGGHGGPFARLLAGARWAQSIVPLQFRVVRPSRALRELPVAQRTRFRSLAARLLAGSGAAWLGNELLTVAKRGWLGAGNRDGTNERVDEFGDWADEIWARCRDRYEFSAVRDRRALNFLFPAGFEPVSRIRVRRGQRDIGWVCTQVYDTKGSSFEAHFGDLRMGLVSDCFADPADAAVVMKQAVDHLMEDRVDLILTNQAHPAWYAAAGALGFWGGPSNLAFYRSPALEKLLPSAATNAPAYHLTRSDGDGPERNTD